MVRTMAFEITVPRPKRSAKLPRARRPARAATWLPLDSTTTGAVLVLIRSLVSGLLGMVGETIEGWQGWVAGQPTTSA